MSSPHRSMSESVVIPELADAEVGEAVAWLSEKFGFVERRRIGTYRAQLVVGAGGAIVITRRGPLAKRSEPARLHAVMVRVGGVGGHHAIAVRAGAKILRPPLERA